MRSKTEWQTGSDGSKSKPVRVGLSPEQGKGIEYEFDILFEITPEHLANIIKDRTGKFQDRIIEKPGKEFGQELVAWLNEGAPPPPPADVQKTESKKVVDAIVVILTEKTPDLTDFFTDEERKNVKSDILNTNGDIKSLEMIAANCKKVLEDRRAKYQPIPFGDETPEPAATAPTASKPASKSDQHTLRNELREIMRKKYEEQQQANATDEQRAQITASIAKDLGLKPASSMTQETTAALPAGVADDGFVDDIPGQEEQVPAMFEIAELDGPETSDGQDIF